MFKKFQDGCHFQNFKKSNKIVEPLTLVSKCINYHSGLFYPTGIREGIYCDLLAITTLNLVIIVLLLEFVCPGDFSEMKRRSSMKLCTKIRHPLKLMYQLLKF